MAALFALGSERNRLRMERQRLLTRTPLHGEHCSVATGEGGAGDAMAGGSELFESLCIATQERKLLAREKGVLESILKSTMEEISRMLEVEALNNEQRRNLEDRLRQSEKQATNLSSDAEEERRRANRLRDEVSAAQERLKLSEAKRHEAERTCAQLEPKLAALREEVEAARTAAMSLREKDAWERQENRLLQAEETVQQQQQQLSELLLQAGEHAKERAIWQDQRISLAAKGKENERLCAELKASEKQAALATELQKELADVKDKLHNTLAQKENEERQREAVLKEHRQVLDENKRMQQRIAELQTANVGLTHKTECLQKDAEHAARRHDEQTTRLRKVEEEAASQAKALAAAEGQIESLKNECAARTREIDASNRIADEAKKEMAEMKKRMLDAFKEAERVAELERLLSSTRHDADRNQAALLKDVEELRQTRQADARQIATLQDKANEWHKISEALAAEKNAIQDERNRMHCRLQLCNQELEYHRAIERASEARSTDWLHAHSHLLNKLQRRPDSNS
eukprot:Tamp_10090.p1 GENE.Tamp_10090~~Tamp_10090.p1  ORF type:complete len:594 (+),score=154.55 Tamp_10090:225-1784(+)